MYEAKYSKYITKSSSRFASSDEIKSLCEKIDKDSIKSGCGAVLYSEGDTIYVDNSDAHIYIQGATGSKKSRIEATLIILSTIKAGENLIVNDPKGELYSRTVHYAIENGYKIRLLNFRDPLHSHGWNPLFLSRKFDRRNDAANSEQSVSDLKSALIGPSKEKTVDIYWSDMAGEVVKYCNLLLKDSVPDPYYNISNLIQLSNECNSETLRKLLNEMDQNTNAAISMHSVLDLSAEKTSSCIFSAVKQLLIPFYENQSMLELLCSNDIDFDELLDDKTVFYLIYPDEKKSLGFLINLFNTQCYQYLVSQAASFPKHKLKTRVNFVMDEFGNLPVIDSFENRISEARGYNIRYFLFTQSFGQLKTKYKENADTIIANCDWIIFPGKDIDFYEKVSKMCGTEYDYYGTEKKLISPSELLHLRKNDTGTEALILKNGYFPFVTQLPDYKTISFFDQTEVDTVPEVKHKSKPKFITFDDWISGLGDEYAFPYCKKDEQKKKNNKTKQKKRDDSAQEYFVNKKLQEAFDALFTDD